MRRLLSLLALASLAGCDLVRQREIQAQMVALREQSAAAMQECGAQHPAGNPKTAVVRARCVNDALAIVRPALPYPDLMDIFMADHALVAEDIQAGRTTIAQGNAMLAHKWSELVAEEQRRNLANRSAAAQEQVAAASLLAAGPKSCSRYGNTVTCF